MRSPLGAYGIAHSQLERIGYNPLQAQGPLEQALGGGGGGGFGFQLGQRPMNDMEKTIAAHDYPGGFKVATDQYAAKYSDQLDAMALEELKHKYPQGPASGGTWDDFSNQLQQKRTSNTRWGPLKPVQKLTMKSKAASTPSYYMNKGKSSDYGMGNWKKYTGGY